VTILTTFVALYRGPSVAAAKLIAVTADPTLVVAVSRSLLSGALPPSDDPVVSKLDGGRRSALRVIHREAADASRV
jgi:hypothetical protein